MSSSERLAPSVGSPEQAVDKILTVAHLKPGETLYDLGCGDGRILIRAAKKYKVKAVGIEISRDLAARAAEDVREQGLTKQVKVIHGDFMKDRSECRQCRNAVSSSFRERHFAAQP